MDLEYRQNHFYKPPTWRTCTAGKDCYTVKNLFELKNASRVLLENNRMEGSWGGYSQFGFAIMFTPRGAWSHDDNITARYNYISHVAGLMAMDATLNCHLSGAPGNVCPTYWQDSASAGNWSIHDLLFDDVNPNLYAGGGSFQIISQFKVNPPTHDVKIDHVTAITTDTKIISMQTDASNPQPKMGPFSYTNSIAIAGKSNIVSSGGTPYCAVNGNPIKTFTQCFTTYNVTKNLIIGWKRSQPPWPAGNQYPANPAAVFTNFQLFGDDYHVLAPFKNAGLDGKDLGADINMINKLLQNVN